MTDFHEKHDIAGSLDDLVVAEIARTVTATEPGGAPGDAAVGVVEAFRAVRGAHRGHPGLLTALRLQEAGADVAVLEAGRVGGGATGHTTAKLSSLHGLTYAGLVRRHGEEKAGLHGAANQAGIERIAAPAMMKPKVWIG